MSVELPLEWASVDSAFALSRTAFAELDPDIADAALMVVSELVENAVKYSVPGGSLSLRIDVEGARALIEVKNTPRSPDDVGRLEETVHRLHQADSSSSAMRSQIARVSYLRPEESGLGLARVCHEAQAAVDLTVDERVTVRARVPEVEDLPLPADLHAGALSIRVDRAAADVLRLE